MQANLLELLRGVDTPSVCNAIERIQGGRGFAGFTRGTPCPNDAARTGRIVGYARTARIRGSAPPSEPAQSVRARRMAYYRYMAQGPQPVVAVIEDLDFPRCNAAFWGEINTSVHRAFGLSGALTNGVMRDLDALPDDFGILAGSVGPSHAHVHVLEIDKPVRVFDLVVAPGDLIHADRHGAVVIPPEAVPELAGAIDALRESERLILEPARAPGFSIEEFEAAWVAFEAARGWPERDEVPTAHEKEAPAADLAPITFTPVTRSA